MEQNSMPNLMGLGHTIRDIILQMKPWYEESSGQILYGLVGIGCSLLIAFLVYFILRRVLIRLANRYFSVGNENLEPMAKPLSLLVLWFCLSVSFDLFKFPASLDTLLDKVLLALIIFTFLIGFLRVCQGVVEWRKLYLKAHRPDSYGMGKLLMDLGFSIVRLLAWCYALFSFLQNVLGFDISHLLVGAGVVGMALAFAAQNTIANVFGAFSILGSRLFKVGDWIKVNGVEGGVEEIGFRSVRLRAADSHVIDIPNRLIADSQVENISSRTCWRESFTFGLVYQTTPDQIRQALTILDEIGRDLADLMVPNMPVKFSFMLCNDFSLDITGFVWFKATRVFDMRAARNRFNLEVMTRFNAAGLDFAYPTSTVFLEKTEAPKTETKGKYSWQNPLMK